MILYDFIKLIENSYIEFIEVRFERENNNTIKFQGDPCDLTFDLLQSEILRIDMNYADDTLEVYIKEEQA